MSRSSETGLSGGDFVDGFALHEIHPGVDVGWFPCRAWGLLGEGRDGVVFIRFNSTARLRILAASGVEIKSRFSGGTRPQAKTGGCEI